MNDHTTGACNAEASFGYRIVVNWEQQLGEIVRKAWHVPIHVPTFEEWLQTTGYLQIPEDLNGPLDLQSVMRTLYRQYRNEYPDAA